MASNWGYIASVGGTSSGTGNTSFSSPRGLATDGRYLYVCDTGNHRIKKLKLHGLAFVAHLGDLDVSTGNPTSGSGDTGFSSPEGIFHRDGYLFIADRGNNRIKIHRAYDGKYLSSFGTGTLSAPRGLCGNRKYLWVADSGNNRIVKYDIPTLTVVETKGSSGSGVNQLNLPIGICRDPHERQIYIADNNNFRVLKWDDTTMTERDSITSIGLPLCPLVLNDILYVTLAENIKAYATSTLALQGTGGSAGTDDGEVSSPAYIVSHNNTLIFTEIGNHRLTVWYNYDPRRAYTSHSDPTIDGDWFVNPVIPIGGEQQGEEYTIGGSAQSDQFRWIEENADSHLTAWSKET